MEAHGTPLLGHGESSGGRKEGAGFPGLLLAGDLQNAPCVVGEP